MTTVGQVDSCDFMLVFHNQKMIVFFSLYSHLGGFMKMYDVKQIDCVFIFPKNIYTKKVIIYPSTPYTYTYASMRT